MTAAIQRWAREHEGSPPKSTEWINRGEYWPPRSAVYGNRGEPFRTWGDAIEAAGFPRPIRGKRKGERSWDRDEVIREIQRLSVDGVAPYSGHLAAKARRYVGSWSEACALAGVKPRYGSPRNPKWTAERVVEEIQALAIGDLPPSVNEVERGLYSVAWQMFGGWPQAVEAAGYVPLGSGAGRRWRRRQELLRKFRNGSEAGKEDS